MTPDGAVGGKCRACDARMLWVVTAAGKRMPLDPRPRPDGNVYLDGTAHAIVLGRAARERLDAARAKNGQEALVWYVSHFATCPGRARPARRPDPCLVVKQTPTGLPYQTFDGKPCGNAATTRLADGTPACDEHAHAAELADDVEVAAVPDPARFVDSGDL